MEAVIARDAERAAVLMERHLELTTRVLMKQSWPGVPRPAATRRAGQMQKRPPDSELD
jgi:hypothetical protein